MRAIWTPEHRDADCDEVAAEPPPPFDAPLQRPGDRRDIARSARRPTDTNPSAAPVDVHRLALSPLGAWADVRGAWSPPASGDLVEWEHRSAMGRDQRVKVVRSGYLYPWGHKAALVELTERKILPSPDGPDAAYLRYRFFLVITQPVRTYIHPDVSSDLAHPTQPLRTIEFLTRETPTLDTWRPDPAAAAIPDGNVATHGAGAFWPKVGGTEFRFAIEARDWTGRLSSTAVTGIFVGFEEARNGAVLADVERAYADETSSDTGTPVERPGLRTSAFRGQPVAYAVEGERDDTSLETAGMTFAGERRRGAPPGDRDWPFSAVLASAAVRIPAVSEVAGYTQDLAVTYDERFEPAHPESNPAELFLKVGDAPHLDFTSLGADKAGGVATPNMRIGAVSRSNGPVGDNVDSVFLGEFEPAGFFPEDAKLLGGVKMGDVIDKSPVVTSIPFCDGSAGGARSAMPKFGVTYDVDDQDPGGGFEGSDRVCFQLDWQTTKLKSFLPVFEIGSDTCLRLQVTVCVGGDDVELKQQRGRVTDCKFTIPKVIRFHFRHVDFEHVSGRPLRVDVAFAEEDGVVLLDALKWIERMMAAIKQFVGGLFGGGDGGGIGDYFDYEISPRAVKLLLALKIPDVPMGALTLSNMRLGLGVEFPLLGSDGTLIIFEFSSRKSPFGITVPPFGGGGFFGIGFVTDELRRIEGAFEFGGRFELDILGAKGEAFVMVGIYYAMKVEDGSRRQELAAYLRAGGSVTIIKLVRVSVEFYMVLMYIADESDPDGNSLCGETTVKVEVSIAFFSAGVDLTFRKCFRGAEAGEDPDSARSVLPGLVDTAVADSPASSPKPFRDAVGGREGWREYWRTFAA